MPVRKEPLEIGEYYHVFGRGVEGRRIFLDKKDHMRFIHDLFEFNDEGAIFNLFRRFRAAPAAGIERKPRKLLVEILAFCLMPNHYHLLVRQLLDKGISRFMQKLCMGYAKYFNERYERSGVLFQGPFRAKHVGKENYLTGVSRYIHLNALELFSPDWKEEGIKDIKKAAAFLRNYRWSSYPDYVGERNFPSVSSREFLLEYFGGPKAYEKFVLSWAAKDLTLLSDLTLE